jgi:outer membrane scaffolding protein for murein synthesis (MipA/OmpV family)
MPSVSKKQHNFMEAIAHSPSFAKKVGVPQSVGKDFSAADKGLKFSKGGDMMNKMKMFEKSGKDMEKKGMREGSKKDMAMDRMQMMGMKKGGMAEGGKADMAQDKAMIKKAFKQHDMQEHKGGKGTTLKLSKGGFTKSADGVATKGKTKGTMIAMCGGGMYKGKK